MNASKAAIAAATDWRALERTESIEGRAGVVGKAAVTPAAWSYVDMDTRPAVGAAARRSGRDAFIASVRGFA